MKSSEINNKENILTVDNLSISLLKEQQKFNIVDNISFKLKAGTSLGIVGESGCGKSITAMAIMNLLPKPYIQITSGTVYFKQQEITNLTPKQLTKIRGKNISIVFQEPMTALNPVQSVGKQIIEVFDNHFPQLTEQEKLNKTINLLKEVGIPEPELRVKAFLHQLSGGMRQRVMIAIALAAQPDILIADEPTTALDVTIQAQILNLIKQLQIKKQMSSILITHNMGLVAQFCEEIIIMYAGQIVEYGKVKDIFRNPLHPYTKDLLSVIPTIYKKSKQPLDTIKGHLPDYKNLPVGCYYRERCKEVSDKCKLEPSVKNINDDHQVKCQNY